MKYRKKPVVIEAVQFERLPGEGTYSEAYKRIEAFYPDVAYTECESPVVRTLEGNMVVNNGDWIIKGTAGEFYPCKADIFPDIYEPVDDVQEKG